MNAKKQTNRLVVILRDDVILKINNKTEEAIVIKWKGKRLLESTIWCTKNKVKLIIPEKKRPIIKIFDRVESLSLDEVSDGKRNSIFIMSRVVLFGLTYKPKKVILTDNLIEQEGALWKQEWLFF